MQPTRSMGETSNPGRQQEEQFFKWIEEASRISESQEQLLKSMPFVGETENTTQHHDSAPPVVSEVSAPVVVESLMDTDEGLQDIFHTPPEEPSSDEQRQTLPVDVDVGPCVVNAAVDINAGSQAFIDLCGSSDGSEFMDLGGDSELGLSEATLAQEEIGTDKFPDCDIPECLLDELRVLDELLAKKQKLSQGFDGSSSSSSGNHHLGVQSQGVKEGMENRDNVNILGKKNSSVLEENAGTASNEEEDRRKKGKYFVFDVLKALAENNTGAEAEENDDDGLSLLEAAKRSGITFPRPRWWPDNY